jgi:3-hydroxybutyryl-CoA dehydratase
MRWSDPFEQLSEGERFESAERVVRDTDVIVFSALTGDWHPQHCDPQWAAASPFGERIAHGMLVLSLAVGLVPLDPERVIALRRIADVVFKRPVRLEEAIRVSGEITGLHQVDERTGLVDFTWKIRNQAGALVCRAAVQLVWRADAPAAHDHDEGAGGGRAEQAWHEPITGGARAGEFTPLPL